MENKVFFDNEKGLKLCGVLSNPSEKADVPVVVLAHGYGSHKDRPKYLTLTKEFEKLNIAAFRFDFLGRGESGGNFEDITISEGVNDILKSIEMLKKRGFSRFALVGVSFGGISSAMAASCTDELSALSLICPVSDYVEKRIIDFSEEEMKEWKETGFAEIEGKPLKYQFFEDAKNNIVYDVADKITVPTLLIHGTADNAVPFDQSRKLSKMLPDVKFVAVEGANHRFTEKEHFNIIIAKTVKFISEKLNEC